MTFSEGISPESSPEIALSPTTETQPTTVFCSNERINKIITLFTRDPDDPLSENRSLGNSLNTFGTTLIAIGLAAAIKETAKDGPPEDFLGVALTSYGFVLVSFGERLKRVKFPISSIGQVMRESIDKNSVIENSSPQEGPGQDLMR